MPPEKKPILNVTIFAPDNKEVYTSLTVDRYDVRTGNWMVTDDDGDECTLNEVLNDGSAYYNGTRPSRGE